MNNLPVLTKSELHSLLSIVKNVVENHKNTYPDDKLEKIHMFLATSVMNANFYQVVLEKPIMDLVETVAGDRDICNFVLSATALVSQWMATADFQHDRVIKTLADSLEWSQCRFGDLTLLPAQIQDSVRVESGWVQGLLEQNMWLVVLYLYNLSYTEL